jgi:hypothetical protein
VVSLYIDSDITYLRKYVNGIRNTTKLDSPVPISLSDLSNLIKRIDLLECEVALKDYELDECKETRNSYRDAKE